VLPRPRSSSPSPRAEGLEVATAALAAVRKVKSDVRRKLRTPVRRAVISDTRERVAALRAVLDDFRVISAPYVDVFEVEGDRITSERLYFDQVELLTQLGLMPETTAASA
jgi:ketosteroid isomerase-like protein